MWLGFWRQCGHGHTQACEAGKDGHRVSRGAFRLTRMALFLHFFNLDSWPWVRGSNHPGWFSSAARLQIRTDSYKHNVALLRCNFVPILHFMTAGCGCKSQQEITLKLSQVFKGNAPLSPLPQTVPVSRRSPCPELRALITLVPPWLFHRPLHAAWGAACAGQMQPQGQDSRWVPRGISQWNMATYSVQQEAPSCHGGSQPECSTVMEPLQ